MGRYLVWGLFCLALAACQSTPNPTSTPVLVPTTQPPIAPLTVEPAPATVTTAPLPSPTSLAEATPSPPSSPTPVVVGPTVTRVQFALDLDENNQPVYPAERFVFGVTRIYVVADYAGLDGIEQLESVWSLEGVPFIASPFEWAEAEPDAGRLILYLEDPMGVRRGQWTWQLKSGDEVLGEGGFRISGEPGYVNQTWGLSFDPPSGWYKNSEIENLVSYASPDEDYGLLVRVDEVGEAGPTEAEQAAALDLDLWQQTYTQAHTVSLTPTQLSRLPAILSQIRFRAEDSPKVVWVVSAVGGDKHYSLWLLSDVAQADWGRQILQSVARGVRLDD